MKTCFLASLDISHVVNGEKWLARLATLEFINKGVTLPEQLEYGQPREIQLAPN